MKSAHRLILSALMLMVTLALAGLWLGTGARAQTRPGTAAWPRASATPTPTPTPTVTTATLTLNYDPTNGTQSRGAIAPVAVPAVEELVPLEIKLPKPMFIGTPRDIRTPNLETQPSGYAASPSPIMGSRVSYYPTPQQYHGADSFGRFSENPFQQVGANPLSTFSIDVDTASYAIMRAMLNQGSLPPADAVRIEELINYFSYDYPPPPDGVPFSVSLDLAQCPWAPTHKLARIGLKGREIEAASRPDSNLVFLIDVSGSMADFNKLPLVKRVLLLLLDKLGPRDRVAIVVYAGAAGLVLEPTQCDDTGKRHIRQAIDSLGAGGSTQGSAGIQLAYDLATRHFITGGTNRVILCTDGDFNVGITSRDELGKLIAKKAKSKIFLTVLGFGMGNLKDDTMETLADKGNGNYGYIDTIGEGRKLLGEALSGTLVTIARDVKIQVEFNPAEVGAYRLIGYENRKLNAEDFNNDKKDAGEIGAGHMVTALYEIVPPNEKLKGTKSVDPLKYQVPLRPRGEAAKGELLTVKLRYKEPDGKESKLLSVVLRNGDQPFERAAADFRFVAAVASFGMILRDSPHRGETNLDHVIEAALDAKGTDEFSLRDEFVSLVRQAKELQRLNEGGHPIGWR